ncbi:hypothetical protein QZH41_002364 [Actinostola sp. cb2023]|nr:hypothetical protein QZH41_002364 [Actinostola sp. cb2023]
MTDRLRNRSVTFSVLENTKDENRVEDRCQAETVKARRTALEQDLRLRSKSVSVAEPNNNHNTEWVKDELQVKNLVTRKFCGTENVPDRRFHVTRPGNASRTIIEDTTLDKQKSRVENGGFETEKSYQLDVKVSWFVCVCSTLANIIIIGCPYTYGILFPKILREFQSGKAKTAMVPSLAIALSACLCPVSAKLCNRFGCRVVIVCSGLTCALGLLASSFAPNIYVLYFTYGCMAKYAEELGIPGHRSSWMYFTMGCFSLVSSRTALEQDLRLRSKSVSVVEPNNNHNTEWVEDGLQVKNLVTRKTDKFKNGIFEIGKSYQLDGKFSWFVCLCSSMANIVVIGTMYTYGILFPRILEEFQAGKARTALVVSIAMALWTFLCPVSAKLCNRFGCRAVMVCSGLTGALGLLGSSFAPNLYVLYFTYGFGSRPSW